MIWYVFEIIVKYQFTCCQNFGEGWGQGLVACASELEGSHVGLCLNEKQEGG